MRKNLEAVINAIVTEDTTAASSAFHDYLRLKTQSILMTENDDEDEDEDKDSDEDEDEDEDDKKPAFLKNKKKSEKDEKKK